MGISINERVYGLSLLWKEAAYNFAYWDERPDLDWDKAYSDFLPLVMAEEDPYEYYKLLERFVALLRDGHTFAEMPEELRPKYRAPVMTKYLEGKHILTCAPKEHEHLLYSEITSVNDMPLCDYLDMYVLPYIWHEKLDSAFFQGSVLGYAINCRERGVVTIGTAGGDFSYTHGEKVEEAGVPDFYQLKHDEFKIMKNVVASPDNILCIDITADNIAYILVPSFVDKRLKDELFKNIDLYKDCAGFVIDVRWNGGGNSDNANALTQLFFDGAFREDPSDSPIYIANYGAYAQHRDLDKLDISKPWEKKIYDIGKRKMFNRESLEIRIKECPAYLNQPVVILSSCVTASAAESFLCLMKTNNRATIVGTASYGSNGQPFIGRLPGGGRYGICTQKCYDMTGVSYNGTGILPDVPVEYTIADFKTQHDALFDAGLSVLRAKILQHN